MPVEVKLSEGIRDAIEEVFQLDSTPDTLKNELRSWLRSDSNLHNCSNFHIDELKNRKDSSIPFSIARKVYETLRKGTLIDIIRLQSFKTY